KAVGLGIVEAAGVHRSGQRHVKRVIAEMGGKNAIVVDADADLDQAVPAIVYSAFGYAGQKCSACSRLIVVESVYEELMRRLVGAARSLRVGHPREMGTQVGPLIDADAHKRVRSYVELAEHEGTVLFHQHDVPATGFFVGPTIVSDVSSRSRLATEEIFGPVLTVLRASSFEEALAVALSLRPQSLRRYKDVVRLLVKYGRRDVVAEAGLDDVLEGEDGDGELSARGEDLARDLEALGPTYVKVGQLLSTRADLLPA